VCRNNNETFTTEAKIRLLADYAEIFFCMMTLRHDTLNQEQWRHTHDDVIGKVSRFQVSADMAGEEWRAESRRPPAEISISASDTKERRTRTTRVLHYGDRLNYSHEKSQTA